MTDYTAIVDRYLATWNEPDPAARGAAIAEQWTADGTYTDPLAAVSGHDGVAAVIAGAREMFPGHEFRALPTVDGHHGIVRFGWELVPSGGTEPTVVGFDVAVVTADGRLQQVLGFLDKAPIPATS
jgi:SnoaL-like domain